MLASLKSRQRHHRLMRVAHRLLREAFAHALSPGEDRVTAQDIAAYAFGRHQIDIDADEAQRYLDAARASRGRSITTPAPAVHHSA